MAYSRPHIRQALAAAREAGKPVEGFADDREMVIALERWGFLPINQDDVDERIRAWYVKNGLARPADDTPDDSPSDTPKDTAEPQPGPPQLPPGASSAALEAAEAALTAAIAAMRLARSMAV